MRVDLEGVLVAVAVRDGEDAEDEEDVEEQLEEDTLREVLFLSTFSGRFQDAFRHRVGRESRGICNISQSVGDT